MAKNDKTTNHRTDRGTIIKMDPNSDEWKARLAKIRADLDKKWDGCLTFDEDFKADTYVLPGYRNSDANAF